MKRLLLISLLYLISIAIVAQKVIIGISQTKNARLSGWQVIDNLNSTVFSGNGYLQEDSVLFSLDANNYYFLKVSVSEAVNTDSVLLVLNLNGEPILHIKSDLGKGDHLFPFFTGIPSLTPKITGGTGTVISEFPWQIYLISGNFRCGGSIIGDNWVVTAAHCTKNNSGGAVPASEMTVRAGLNNPSDSQDGEAYAVSEVIVHENYNDQTLLNDIALLRLRDNINIANARPIKIVNSNDVENGAIIPGVMTWVTGWGYTHLDPNVLPTTLQKVQLPIVSNAQASTVWKSIPASDLMAGYLNGNKDACNGDSGGPMVVPVLGEYKLAGIVSWGSPDCNTYGAYTRISDFAEWISSKTGLPLFKAPDPVGDSIICRNVESSQYSVSPVSGATAYEWKIYPETAGVITGNSQSSSVIWNVSYFGSLNIIVRVTVGGEVSDWGRLNANRVVDTRVLSRSNDTTLCAGHSVSLSIKAEGYNLKYRWFKNDQVLAANNSPLLTFSSSKTDDSGDYKCEASGYCGTVVSTPIRLTVYPVTHIVAISPDIEVPFGNDATLTVNAEGHNLIYEWQKDNIPVANSNTASLFLPGLDANDIGLYRVKVSGTCGTLSSSETYVYVKRSDSNSVPQVFVWPSVTIDDFTVALNDESIYNIRIYNTTGLKIREILNCRYQTTVNVVNLASGVYIVEVSNKNFRKSIKIIRE
jgi:hypothetical protein